MNTSENMEITQLTKKIDEVQSEVKEIRNALLGNEFTKDGGLVGKVLDHEIRIETLEDKAISDKMLVKIMVFIASTIFAGVVGFLISLFAK